MAKESIHERAVREAQQELKKEQIAELKSLAKKTLEALEAAETRRADAVKDIQLLKKDLDDLREGRVDKIRDRHEADKTADKRSPLTEVALTSIFTGGVGGCYTGGSNQYPIQNTSFTVNTNPGPATVTVTPTIYCSQQIAGAIADAVSGTYVLNNGSTRYW